MQQQCLVCLEERADVHTRHMLPCRCKLKLCEPCVTKLDACVYHRTRLNVNVLAPLVTHIHTNALERSVMMDELKRLTDLVVVVTYVWMCLNFVITLMFLVDYDELGVLVSAVSVALCLGLHQVMHMSRTQTRSFVPYFIFYLWVVPMLFVVAYKRREIETV